MRKNYYSDNDTISVYQFMEMCGLNVKYRKNILLSHKAMIRKLELRNGTVMVPASVPFEMLNNSENVLCGKIILVKDDYDKVIPYQRPFVLRSTIDVPQTEEERAKRREELLKEMEEETEVLKPGYLKYLRKKELREMEEEKLELRRVAKEDEIDEASFRITEKINRTKKIGQRRNNYYY